MKSLNNYWIDCLEISHRHSYFPQDDLSPILWFRIKYLESNCIPKLQLYFDAKLSFLLLHFYLCRLVLQLTNLLQWALQPVHHARSSIHRSSIQIEKKKENSPQTTFNRGKKRLTLACLVNVVDITC